MGFAGPGAGEAAEDNWVVPADVLNCRDVLGFWNSHGRGPAPPSRAASFYGHPASKFFA